MAVRAPEKQGASYHRRTPPNQNVLVVYPSQMLLNICSESQGLEGLLSGSELQSLLIATTCLREHSCLFWKQPTFCVLRAISKAQSPSVIQYLRSRFQETRCGLQVAQGVPLAESKAQGPIVFVAVSAGSWKEEIDNLFSTGSYLMWPHL
jgi:hypothetical protein